MIIKKCPLCSLHRLHILGDCPSSRKRDVHNFSNGPFYIRATGEIQKTAETARPKMADVPKIMIDRTRSSGDSQVRVRVLSETAGRERRSSELTCSLRVPLYGVPVGAENSMENASLLGSSAFLGLETQDRLVLVVVVVSRRRRGRRNRYGRWKRERPRE